ncbi:MAG: hypothetical protein BGO40_10840 [Chryseobacterium sp. 39-10]|nr:MAG: hypothetical protein BGO40_10840 [Chryseobacterium sp. 39-10]
MLFPKGSPALITRFFSFFCKRKKSSNRPFDRGYQPGQYFIGKLKTRHKKSGLQKPADDDDDSSLIFHKFL